MSCISRDLQVDFYHFSKEKSHATTSKTQGLSGTLSRSHMEKPSKRDQATHYQVLNLTPALLDSSHHDPSSLIKRAYHRALLQNHPDKSDNHSQRISDILYTVDQISKAFNVLSSFKDRTAYDVSLRVSGSGNTDGTKFQTGVEDIDLDDLLFDEEKGCWYRDCRCGNDRGYIFTETELDEGGDEDELMVGCLDCSLWLRVHFSTIEE